MLDLEELKLKPNAVGLIKTAPLLRTIRTKKPENTDFFRIRRGDEWTMEFPIFAPKGKTGSENEKYLVMPEYQQELAERNSLQPVRFYFGIIWGSNILFLLRWGQGVDYTSGLQAEVESTPCTVS